MGNSLHAGFVFVYQLHNRHTVIAQSTQLSLVSFSGTSVTA